MLTANSMSKAGIRGAGHSAGCTDMDDFRDFAIENRQQ